MLLLSNHYSLPEWEYHIGNLKIWYKQSSLYVKTEIELLDIIAENPFPEQTQENQMSIDYDTNKLIHCSFVKSSFQET